MADRVRGELGIEAELVRGWLGELTVWVDGRKVFRKGWLSSPPDERYVASVREALGTGCPPAAQSRH